MGLMRGFEIAILVPRFIEVLWICSQILSMKKPNLSCHDYGSAVIEIVTVINFLPCPFGLYPNIT